MAGLLHRSDHLCCWWANYAFTFSLFYRQTFLRLWRLEKWSNRITPRQLTCVNKPGLFLGREALWWYKKEEEEGKGKREKGQKRILAAWLSDVSFQPLFGPSTTPSKRLLFFGILWFIITQNPFVPGKLTEDIQIGELRVGHSVVQRGESR